ncbi:MAG: SPOR domain-containing protein [Bradymonadales bacterium]|jgi:cell division protein FtsN
MRRQTLGIKQVSLMVFVAILVVGGVFFLGQQLMNGRLQQSPKLLGKSILENLAPTKSLATNSSITKQEFNYEFFSILEQAAPPRDLPVVALETNPTIIARQQAKRQPNVKKEPTKPQRYALQLSSFGQKHDAQAFVNALAEKGYKASVVKATNESKNVQYEVHIEGGNKRKNAELLLAKIEKKTGHKGAIVETM